MQLVRWSPLREMNSLHRHFNSVWDDFFTPGLLHDVKVPGGSWNPAVDVFEDEARITIKAELPGIDKNNIALDVKGRVLSLRGERRDEAGEEKDTAYRRERFFGRFERSFRLPMEVDPETIRADYKDGVLTVEVPKPEKQQPRQITIH